MVAVPKNELILPLLFRLVKKPVGSMVKVVETQALFHGNHADAAGDGLILEAYLPYLLFESLQKGLDFFTGYRGMDEGDEFIAA